MDKRLKSIQHIDNLYICCTGENVFIHTTYGHVAYMWYGHKSFVHTTYGQFDTEKPKFLLHKGNFSALFNSINAFIHKNNSFYAFHMKD